MKQDLIDIIKSAGVFAKEGFYSKTTVSQKTPKDLVTDLDREIEIFIKKELQMRYPEASFYGEETGYAEKSGAHIFVIDPIDGTANFIFGVPYFAVSLAEIVREQVCTAIVYNPISGDLFYADNTAGAYLNASRISTSKRKLLPDCFIILGFSANNKNILKYQQEWPHVFEKAKKALPLLSPSLNLCAVASGKVDAFIDFGCSFEGLVAGAFILQTAGGKVLDYTGSEYDYRRPGIIATNGVLRLNKTAP
jgi:myo-inositol-1(or 4)-monophosphatase